MEVRKKVREAAEKIELHNKYFESLRYGIRKSVNYERRDFDDMWYVKCKDDDDNDVKISVFWLGYFEKLEYLEIISFEN